MKQQCGKIKGRFVPRRWIDINVTHPSENQTILKKDKSDVKHSSYSVWRTTSFRTNGFNYDLLQLSEKATLKTIIWKTSVVSKRVMTTNLPSLDQPTPISCKIWWIRTDFRVIITNSISTDLKLWRVDLLSRDPWWMTRTRLTSKWTYRYMNCWQSNKATLIDCWNLAWKSVVPMPCYS